MKEILDETKKIRDINQIEHFTKIYYGDTIIDIDENSYGGIRGKLPEFIILWDDYQDTIKTYKYKL
tara:strand:+ start:216 stop:413 length:198 start_codon:yes stop_codon:yes gene_type:complete